MVPQGDIKTMAKAIGLFLSDKDSWETASKQGKEIISNEFDIDFMVKRQEELCAKLLKERGL